MTVRGSVFNNINEKTELIVINKLFGLFTAMYFDQAKYSYRPRELKRCIRPDDFWKYSSLTPNNVDLISDKASTGFYSNAKFKPKISKTILNGKEVFSCKDIEELLCIRRTDEIISKTYNIRPTNRDEEVRQLIEVLKAETYGKIVRSDISSFFESVSFKKTIKLLEKDGFKNYSCLRYLKEINDYLELKFNYEGLPRGLSISTTLSEFLLQSFDKKILNKESIIYYSRFVDDFVIVSSYGKIDLTSFIEASLPEELRINNKKTLVRDIDSDKSVIFLGYCLGLRKKRFVKIADNKIGKAKKRIILSLKDYLRNSDFDLLCNRMKYLSSSIILEKNSREKKVYIGYRHVYKLCDDNEIIKQLNDLDNFIYGIIYSKRYGLGKKLFRKLGRTRINKLKEFSFKSGYTEKITHQMDRNIVSRIKKVWSYE